MDMTTIQVSMETKEKLDAFKVHPRQSYEEILRNIIKERNSLVSQ